MGPNPANVACYIWLIGVYCNLFILGIVYRPLCPVLGCDASVWWRAQHCWFLSEDQVGRWGERQWSKEILIRNQRSSTHQRRATQRWARSRQPYQAGKSIDQMENLCLCCVNAYALARGHGIGAMPLLAYTLLFWGTTNMVIANAVKDISTSTLCLWGK